MGKTWNIVGIRTVGNVEQTVTVATVHELEYHGEWMGDEYVTVTVKSPEPVDFHFGDYLLYRSEYFRINYDPNVVKKAGRVKYGEGFTYDNIKLYSDASKMKSIDFKDIVLYDNNISYTSLSAFSFYAASIEDLADRLQANLDRESVGWKVYTPNRTRYLQRVGLLSDTDWNDYYPSLASQQKYNEILGETDINVDVSDTDRCWEVTKMSYEKFGLSYYVTGKNVVIGGDAIVADHIFRYGKNLGMYEIERTSDENQEIVTKLFAYGSDKNIPLNYYANVGKKIKFQVSQKRELTIVGSDTEIEIWIAVSWDSVSAAFAPAYEVILACGNKSARFAVAHASDEESQVQSNTTTYLTFTSTEADEDAMEFFNYVDVGDYIYVTSGADMNVIPSEYIEIPQDYDYPSLLSVNKLMLPGFPTMSLDEWVLEKIGSTSGDEKAQWEAFYAKYIFSTDKHDPWVMSKNSSDIGIWEGLVNYDGSQQKEIYPTIDNTSSNVAHSAQTVYDNGYLEEGANIQFFIAVYRGDGYLDWRMAYDTATNKDEVYIEMRSGFCTGRKFKVVKVEEDTYQQDGTELWKLTCEREKDTSLNRYFPYFDNDVSWYCQVLSDDTFVVTGIQMQKEYIDAASEKMLIATCGYLDNRDHMRYTYLPKIDEIYMQRQDDYIKSGATDKPLIYGTVSYHDTLRPGMKLQFLDADLGIDRYESASTTAPFIDSITIKENGNNGIPTYDVVMRDEKEKGALEKIIEKIEDLTANPPVQVVERQQRTLQTIEYESWVQGGLYYHEDINTETNTLEQSMVWHRGCLWMCLRTLTAQEPWFSNADWACVRANNISLGFYTSLVDPMPIYGLNVRPASIDETVVPFLLIGQEDISSIVTNWAWVRDSGNPELDAVWSGNHTGLGQRVLHLTTADFPSGWDVNGGKVMFTCTATFPFDNDNAQISNQITVT